MMTSKYFAGLIVFFMIALCAGPASAWDTRWQFKLKAPSNSYGSGSRDIGMQKKSISTQ
jgi:hypothetical protein